ERAPLVVRRSTLPPTDDDALDKAAFRRQLDATLRQRDPDRLRQFLLASGQWQEVSVPADGPAAMVVEIPATPAPPGPHAEAQSWLRANGHAQEAELLSGRKKGGAGAQRRGGKRPPQRGGGTRQNGRRP